MRTISKSYKAAAAVLLCLLTAGLIFQSCKKEDEGFRLDAFGPSDVERGSEIFFIGAGMDQVKSIELPDGSVYSENQFRRDGTKGIAFNTSPDYPLCLSGRPVLTLSNGTTFITKSEFRVLNTASITNVPSIEGVINPGDEITITGKVLRTVDAIIFSGCNGGVELPVSSDDVTVESDNVIKFKLPAKAASGQFSLRTIVCDTVYVGGPALAVLEPEILDFPNWVDCSSSEIKITGKNFWRLDTDADGKTTVMFTGGVRAEGTINGDELTVALPRTLLVGTALTVTVYSNCTPITSKQSFSIEWPVITNAYRDAANYVTIEGSCLDFAEKRSGYVCATFVDIGERCNSISAASGATPERIRGYISGSTEVKCAKLTLQSGQVITWCKE